MGRPVDGLLVFSHMGRLGMIHTALDLDQAMRNVLADLRPDLQG